MKTVALPIPAPPELARGISLSRWLSRPEPSAEHLESFVTEADFRRVAALGFPHVRLPIHPTLLLESAAPMRPREDGFLHVDRAVMWAERHRLACVLDLYPPASLEPDGEAALFDAFRELWRAIAWRYRDRPGALFYELMHESRIDDPDRWREVAGALVEAIRGEDEHRAIIVVGTRRGGAADLAPLRPLADGRVIYAFHFYYPLLFTLQGDPRAADELSLLHSVPYPADPIAVEGLIRHVAAESAVHGRAGVPTAAPPAGAAVFPGLLHHLVSQKARRLLYAYAASGCDRACLAGVMEPALAWARRHHVPLYCSQFGLRAAHAPPASRHRWLADVTTLLRSAGAGWGVWEYHGDFGVFEGNEPDTGSLDRDLIQALGLPVASERTAEPERAGREKGCDGSIHAT